MTMDVDKLRDQSVLELQKEVSALTQQLFKLRFQKATGQLENVVRIREVRKDLARVKTIMREKEIAAG